MRIGIACVMQESNTFAATSSRLKDFSQQNAEEIVATNRGTNTEVAGFIDELERLRHDPVPLFSAWAIAGGPIDDIGFDALTDNLLQAIQEMRVDAMLLALHGAWVSNRYDSADAELLRRLRAKLGVTFPIVVSLDLHANVRPTLIETVQGLVGYRTYPHVDMSDTGRKAARLLHEVISSSQDPCIYSLAIPLLASPQIATTDRPPIADIIAELDRELTNQNLLSSSFFCVQPWLDIDRVASTIVVVTKAPDPTVPQVMKRAAQHLWDRRSEFDLDWVQPQNLVASVLHAQSHPVIVSEAFDATTGGAPGDHPGVLSILLPCQQQLSACLFLVDPVAATQAHGIGVGKPIRVALGARSDRRFQTPVAVEAKIAHVSDGAFILKGPVFTGKRVEMGPTAVLEIGRIKVVVGSYSVPVIDPELYRSQKIEPAEQDLVAVKSPSLFRPGYASMLTTVLNLDMPGVCRGNLPKMPFRKINRPIWPLDNFSWHADEQTVLMCRRNQ